MEFILPSSVVLTSFRPSIVPVLGYVEEVGIDDDNRHDAKDTATISTRDKPTHSSVPARPIQPRSRSPVRPSSLSTRWGPRPRRRPPEDAAPSSGRATIRLAFSMSSRADGRSSAGKARRCIITRPIVTTSPRSASRSTPRDATTRSGSTPSPGRS